MKFSFVIPLVISLFLFLVPFFWFEIGEVNLGGDTSRLYFYKPWDYLQSYLLYNIAPSDLGYENISFFMIPFTLTLAAFIGIFKSPSLVLNMFHGFELSTAFLFTFLTIRGLFKFTKFERNSFVVTSGAIIAGFMYITNPILSTNWDKALLSQNQFFLNPIMSYLALSFVQSHKVRFLFFAGLISFIFSANFGYTAAPAVFSFYPFLLLFLIGYSRILKRSIQWKKVVTFIVLLIGIHAFHLLPQIGGILSFGSPSSNTVFSDTAKILASNHFRSIAENIHLVNNLLIRDQSPYVKEIHVWSFLYVSGVALALGVLAWKKENVDRKIRHIFLLLTGLFLLVVFFSTANITEYGIILYEAFFKLPGFQMFRNYYGQFAHSLFFFYSLVFGYGAVIILSVFPQRTRLFLAGGILLFFIVLGLPLFTGYYVNVPIYQSKNIRVPHKINKDFEKVQHFLRSEPDGKVLTLPLTAYGYQLIAGEDGGVYKGPSMIGYLSGRKDFTGYQHFGPYSDFFLKALEYKDYNSVLEILSLVNINYIFYNNDPYIYDNFRFPYDSLKEYFPNQDSIQTFIEELKLEKVYSVGTFSIYKVPKIYQKEYIFSPKTIFPAKTPEELMIRISQEEITNEVGFLPGSEHDVQIVMPHPLFEQIIKDFPFPALFPYVKWEPSSPLYPLILYKEQMQIDKRNNDPSGYIDMNLLLAAKRISEIEKWGKTMPITNNSGFVFAASWEINISRYLSLMTNALVRAGSLEGQEKTLTYAEILEDLHGHEVRLFLLVDRSGKPEADKEKIKNLIKETICKLRSRLPSSTSDPQIQKYTVHFEDIKSEYDVFVSTNSVDSTMSAELQFGDQQLTPGPTAHIGEFISYGRITVQNTLETFSLPFQDLNAPTITINSLQSSLDPKNPYKAEINDFAKDKKVQGSAIHFTDFDSGHYLISFEYDTKEKPWVIGMYSSLIQKKGQKTNKNYFMHFLEETVSDSQSNFNIIINTYDLKDVYVLIKSKDNSPASVVNVTAKKLPPSPELVFSKVIEPISVPPPDVTYMRINPTKFIVNVRNADTPYYLFQADIFDESWKVYKQKSDPSSLFQLFETTFLNPIPSEHVYANGYANAWLIKPDDVGRETSYQLIIEKKNQQLFYFGVFVSAGSIIIAMLLLWRLLMKKKKESNRFGGERLDSKSNLSKNNMVEHLARYRLMKAKKNATALDVGSAEGHGSDILSSKYKKVVGIDISGEAVKRANKFNKHKNVTFKLGSATKIPLKDNSIDVVGAFEVVEHIKDWENFFKELHRVVKPGGLIYMSTPNKAIYNPWSKTPINPHHVFEWYIPQFKKALKPYFTIKNFYGQRTPIYNDHWIWKIVDPLLFMGKSFISYKTNNSLKLKIINKIKPHLDESDVIFVESPSLVKRSRTMLAVCINKK